MERKYKGSGRAKSMPAGLAIGCMVSLGLTLVLSAAVAKLIDIGQLRETAIGYAALAILIASSFAGGITAVSIIKRRTLMVCGLAAAVYYLSLLSITALFFDGMYRGMGVTALVVLCGGGLAVFATSGRGRRGHRIPKYKPAHR